MKYERALHLKYKKIITTEMLKHKAYGIWSFLFILSLMCSYLFYYKEGFSSLFRLLLLCFSAAILSVPLWKILIKVDKFIEIKTPLICKKKNHGISNVAILFLLHLIPFLALYPGLCIYDLGNQIYQYDTNSFNEQHPLLHTYLVGWFKNLSGNSNIGFGLFTLAQIIFVDLAMAYAIHTIYKRNTSTKIRVALLLFYGLFPINSLMAISVTKDVPFSVCMLVFVIDSYKFFENGLNKVSSRIRYYICGTMMLLLRNNAVYAFFPFMLVAIWKTRSHKKRQIETITLCTIIISAITINIGMGKFLNADKGPICEMLSVPAQEMAVIFKNTEDIKTIETIEKYISKPGEYIPYLSDPIKGQLPFYGLDNVCKNFILDAIALNIQYPIDCLNAILYLTQGFWDVLHNPYSEQNYFLVKTDYRGNASLDSKIPILCNWYKSNFYQQKGGLFMNQSIYIWLLLLFLLSAYYRRNRSIVLAGMLPCFYLVTLCFSPGAILRYAWIFILLAPLMLISNVREKAIFCGKS